MNQRRILSRSIALTLGLSAVSAIVPAHGAVIYWDGLNATWNLNTNWSTANNATTPDPLAFPGIGDDATFNITTANVAETIGLGADQAARTLVFNNTQTTGINGGGADQTLTLAAGITKAAGSGAVTIGSATAGSRANLLLGGSQTWTNNGTTTVTVTNGLAGSAIAGDVQTVTFNGSAKDNGAAWIFSSNTSGISDGANGGKLALVLNGTSDVNGGGLNLQLTGANTFTGGITVTKGRLVGGNPSAFGTGPVTVQSAGNNNGGTIFFSNAGAFANDFTIAGNGNNESGQNYALRFSNGNTIGTAANTLTIAPAGATIGGNGTLTYTINSKVTGTGALTLTSGGSSGTGNAIFTNPANDFSGGVIVSSRATLQLNAATAAQNSIVTIQNTNGLKFNTGIGTFTVGGLSGTAPEALADAAGAITLQVGNNDRTGMTYSGALSGAGGLVKIGAGTQTLTGANTYTGATTISAGTLAVNGSLAIDSAVAVNAGTLDGTGSVLGAVTVAGGTGAVIQNGAGTTGALTLGSLTFNGAATINVNSSGSPGLIVSGALATTPASGTVTLNVLTAPAWQNGVTYNLISYGSFAGAITNFTKGTIAGLGARQAGALLLSGNNVALSVTGDTPVWTGAASGVWSTVPVGAPFNWKLQTAGSGTEFLNNDQVIFNDTATGTTTVAINDNTVSPAAVVFNNTTRNYTLVGSNGINTGGLTKSGSGTLTIQNPNGFTGATMVNGGIINYQNAASFGGSSPITVAAGATVQVQGDLIGGSQPLTLSGGGAPGQSGALVNVSGTNSYAGPLTLAAPATIASDAGTLNLTSTAPMTGTGFGLTLAGNGDGLLSAVVSTSTGGTLVKNGSGSWTLAAQTTQNNYSGGTTVNAGTLKVINASGNTASSTTTVLGTGPATVAAGATLWLDYELGATSNTLTYPNAIAGGGTLKVTAPGSGNTATGELTGDLSNFIGTIDLLPNGVSQGKVRFNNATVGTQPSAFATVKIEPGATLFLSSGLTYSSPIQLLGSGNIENLGALRIDNANIAGPVSLFANSSIGSNGTGTVSGVIGETGGSFLLTKLGTATVILTSANTYTGGTTINSGTLSLGNNGALGSGAVNMNGGALAASIPGINVANPILLTAAGTYNTANSFTISGNMTGTTAGNQTVTGTGTLTLAGANSLVFNANAGLTVAGGATATISGSTTIDGAGTLNSGYLTVGTGTTAGTVSIPAGGSFTILGNTAGGSQTILGQNGATTGTLSVDGGSFTVGPNEGLILGNNLATAIGNLIVNAGTATISKGTLTTTGSGVDTTVVMVGRDNGIGNVTLNGGVLATDRQFVRDGSTNAGTGVGNFNFNGGTLRALGAQPDWLRSFDTANFLGLSAVTVQAGGAVIDSNGFDVGINTALAHDATLGASLDGGLKKLGAGTLTLGGTNSYTGTTVVSGGTLLVNGSLSGSTTTVSSGSLGGTGSVTGVTVNSGSSLLGGDGVTPADDLAVGGDLSLQDGSIVRLTLGATGAHSSLTRTAGTWSFDLDQKFLFTDAGATPGLYDNIISGLAANPGTTGTWTIGNPGWIGTFSYDGAGGVDLNLASVPEPRVALTLVAGVPFLFGRRRRRAPAA